jgi:FkbM family methyltransferase
VRLAEPSVISPSLPLRQLTEHISWLVDRGREPVNLSSPVRSSKAFADSKSDFRSRVPVTQQGKTAVIRMYNLAKSCIAPVLGQRVPLRGPARLLCHSYTKAHCRPGESTKRMTTKLGDHFDVSMSSFIEWQLWAFGSYEEPFAELFRCLVRPTDRCIDVGANVGIHAIRLAKLVGSQGEVIAFEPDEEQSRRMRNNLLLNRLANVRVIQAAASDHGGETVLLYRPDAQDSNKGRASLLPHSYLTGSEATVPTATIDDINQGPVALIKIDVEGYEAAVVSGAARTIDSYSPAIIFEYAPEMLLNKSHSPSEWLRKRGYDLFIIRHKRHRLTGRGKVELEFSRDLPVEGTNILAICGPMNSRISSLMR